MTSSDEKEAAHDFQVLGLIIKESRKRLEVSFGGELRKDKGIKDFLDAPSQEQRTASGKQWAEKLKCEHMSPL